VFFFSDSDCNVDAELLVLSRAYLVVLWLQWLLESLRETIVANLQNFSVKSPLQNLNLFCWSSPEPIKQFHRRILAPNRVPPLRIHFLRLQLSVDAVRHSS